MSEEEYRAEGDSMKKKPTTPAQPVANDALFGLFEGVCEGICRRLPDGWTIRVGVDSGWAGVTLVDPDGEEHDMDGNGDLLTDQLRDALAKANDTAQRTAGENQSKP